MTLSNAPHGGVPADPRARRILLVCIAVVASLTGIALGQQGGGPGVAWHSMDGGGVIGATDGTYRLSAGVGQPDTGRAVGPGHIVTGGFWARSDEVAFGLNLFAGWNLVSVPVEPLDSAVDSVLAGAQPGAAWEYRGTHYAPATNIRAGAAYWVHLDSDAVLTIRGRCVYDRTIELGQDWNFVGPLALPPYAAVAMPLDITPANRAAVPIYEWDAAVQDYREASQGEPGKGYLIWALDTCVWECP